MPVVPAGASPAPAPAASAPTTYVVPPLAPPKRITNRGGDVQAFDLRQMRQVRSEIHNFHSPTDLVVGNGILRFRVGPRGLIPYLQVSRHRNDGTWQEVGYLHLARNPGAGSAQNSLVDARIIEKSDEHATVVLAARNLGQIAVTLQRGYAGLRIVHGIGRDSPSLQRAAIWMGIPPGILSGDNTVATGAFDRALRVASGGIVGVYWPPEQSIGDWAIPFRWIPDAASTAQPDSGLVSIKDSGYNDVATLTFQAATGTLRWTQNGVTLASAPITFSAGQVIHGDIRLSSIFGRTLTSRVGTATTHARDALTSPGAAAYAYVVFGATAVAVGATGYGMGGYGTGPYGGTESASGGVGAGGLIDNAMLIADAMTDREAETLAAATSSLGGLPQPESRLVTHLPFDVRPYSRGSAITTSYIYETTEDGGSAHAEDSAGFVKGLSTLQTASKLPGLGLARTDSSFDVAAWVAGSFVGGGGDDVVAQTAQFLKLSEQELALT